MDDFQGTSLEISILWLAEALAVMNRLQTTLLRDLSEEHQCSCKLLSDFPRLSWNPDRWSGLQQLSLFYKLLSLLGYYFHCFLPWRSSAKELTPKPNRIQYITGCFYLHMLPTIDCWLCRILNKAVPWLHEGHVQPASSRWLHTNTSPPVYIWFICF